MQSRFLELAYGAKQKQTRRDRFLAEIEAITPWSSLTQVIVPHYPSNDGPGRPPVGLARILRMYVAQAPALLHGDETDVFGDAGYQGVEKRAENLALPVTWQVTMRPGKRKNLSKSTQVEWLARIEPTKASIRAKVEHPFHVIKNLFRHRKARYQELTKNPAPSFSLFGFANLMLARRWLFSGSSQVAS